MREVTADVVGAEAADVDVPPLSGADRAPGPEFLGEPERGAPSGSRDRLSGLALRPGLDSQIGVDHRTARAASRTAPPTTQAGPSMASAAARTAADSRSPAAIASAVLTTHPKYSRGTRGEIPQVTS